MADLAHLRVIVFQDEGLYVAQCLEHDIVAQAEDIKEALDRLELTIEAEIAMRGAERLNKISPAPKYYQDLWNKPTLKIERVSVPVDHVPPFEVIYSEAA